MNAESAGHRVSLTRRALCRSAVGTSLLAAMSPTAALAQAGKPGVNKQRLQSLHVPGKCQIGFYREGKDAQVFLDAAGGSVANFMFYDNWQHQPENLKFNRNGFNYARQINATPWLKWSPVVDGYREGEPRYGKLYTDILRGEFDSYLRAYAKELCKIDGPFWFDFAHEMNGKWKPYAGQNNGSANDNGALLFVKVWRKVHQMFTQAGLRNAVWVWAPNMVPRPMKPDDPHHLRRYYPGPAFVDYVGFSVYSLGNWIDVPFERMMEHCMPDLERVAPGKPVVLSEMGAVVSPGKAQWITQTYEAIARKFPQIVAFNWFHVAKEGDDYGIDTTPQTLSAFTEAMKNPHYVRTPQPVWG